jgi:hypothetical protein
LTCFENVDCGKDAKLSPTPDGLAVEAKGRQVVIPASGSRRFKYEYEVRFPVTLGYFYPNFQYPTIGLALTIKAPQDYNVKATPAEYEVPGEWRYPSKLFMPGEHVGIVWEKIPSKDGAASCISARQSDTTGTLS